MRVHHVGLVVKSIEESSRLYECLGYSKDGDIVVDDVQHNRLLFLKKESQRLELIEALNEKSTVYNTALQGYHHICFEVDDIEEQVKQISEKKLGKVFTGKIKAPAFSGRHIIFVYLKNRTIIEFLER